MNPGLPVFGVARVADIADQLPGNDLYSWSDARPITPLVSCLAVVCPRRIVVEVVEVVLVSVGPKYHDSGSCVGMLDEAEDQTVDGRDDRLELGCQYVGAVVEARAGRSALHPVVVDRGFSDHREGDRPSFLGVS